MAKDKLFGEVGRFEVWHRENGEYMPVGSVRATDLMGAMVLSIHRHDRRWTDNPEVTAALPEVRSTDVGDVIVNPKGEAHQIAFDRVTGLSFEPIDFPQHREMKALFVEWEQDYSAAKARDRASLFEPGRSFDPPPPANDNERGGRE